MNRILSIIPVLFLLVGCKMDNLGDESAIKFQSGVDFTSSGHGHETLAIYAAEDYFSKFNNIKVKELIGLKAEKLEGSGSRRTYSSSNVNGYAVKENGPLVMGAVAPDWIDQFPELPLVKEWGDIDGVKYPNDRKKWQDDVRTFRLHFLRSKKGNSPVSGMQACMDSRSAIISSSLLAMKYAAQKDKNLAVGFMGVALHTIQDSFSTAHTIRDRGIGWQMHDICTYGESYNDICFHSIAFTSHPAGGGSLVNDDTIWERSPRIRANLRDVAEKAVRASVEYINVVGPLIEETLAGDKTQSPSQLVEKLNNFFVVNKNDNIGGSGLFDCTGINR